MHHVSCHACLSVNVPDFVELNWLCSQHRQAMAKNILVTGATGKQGGAVVSALLASPSSTDFMIYAVTRNASSSAATSLASRSNVKVIEGNLDDPAALFQSAGVPIWGVFSVQTFMGSGQSTATEQRQGIQLIDAAVAHGSVQQFVYASADRGGSRSSSDPTNIPHFISKYHIEKYLEEKALQANMGYTILRPVAFMENLTNDFPGKGFTASWKISLKGKPLQLVATKDVGWFAAQAFTHSTAKQYANAGFAIAGDSLTYQQAADVFQQQTGQPMPTTYDTIAKAFLWAVKDIGLMFKWFGTAGFDADVQALRQLHPGMLSFQDWLQQESAWKSA